MMKVLRMSKASEKLHQLKCETLRSIATTSELSLEDYDVLHGDIEQIQYLVYSLEDEISLLKGIIEDINHTHLEIDELMKAKIEEN